MGRRSSAYQQYCKCNNLLLITSIHLLTILINSTNAFTSLLQQATKDRWSPNIS